MIRMCTSAIHYNNNNNNNNIIIIIIIIYDNYEIKIMQFLYLTKRNETKAAPLVKCNL